MAITGDIDGVVLDSRQFDKAIHALAKVTGKSLEKVIKSEAVSLLSKAMQKTGAASAANITAHYTYKEGDPNEKTIPFVRLNGRKVRVRSIRKQGMLEDGKWNPRKSNPDWKPLQKELKRLMKRAKDRRGLSKATWMLIARDIPRMPEFKRVPKYVTKAYNTLGGGIRRAVKGKEVLGEKYHLRIENASYTAMAPGTHGGPNGFFAFKDAMIGRFLFFKKNMQKGVFDKTAEILAKYPGIAAEE